MAKASTNRNPEAEHRGEEAPEGALLQKAKTWSRLYAEHLVSEGIEKDEAARRAIHLRAFMAKNRVRFHDEVLRCGRCQSKEAVQGKMARARLESIGRAIEISPEDQKKRRTLLKKGWKGLEGDE